MFILLFTETEARHEVVHEAIIRHDNRVVLPRFQNTMVDFTTNRIDLHKTRLSKKIKV